MSPESDPVHPKKVGHEMAIAVDPSVHAYEGVLSLEKVTTSIPDDGHHNNHSHVPFSSK